MDFKQQLSQYLSRDIEALQKTPYEALMQAIEILLEARAGGKWIFSAGNGGSAATASHFANDFVKGLSVEGKARFRVMALNDGVPTVTALANDYDYSLCFAEQLKNYGSAGDVLVVYSGSGNSANVVKAAACARSIGMHVVGFTGRDGGQVAAYCDVNCIAPTNCMEEIEDVHMAWEHALVTAIRAEIQNEQ